jgi:hypothetical protein
MGTGDGFRQSGVLPAIGHRMRRVGKIVCRKMTVRIDVPGDFAHAAGAWALRPRNRCP